MSFDKRSITVNGAVVELDPSSFAIESIDEAQRTSASKMAYWASVCGSAHAEADAADAHYRRWRAKATQGILATDPKAPEWKVKAAIEAHDDFLKLKTALANAKDNVESSERMFEAASKRANLAQSVGALKRETMGKLGTGTTRFADEDDGDSSSAKSVGKRRGAGGEYIEQRDRLKGVLNKKKSKADQKAEGDSDGD